MVNKDVRIKVTGVSSKITTSFKKEQNDNKRIAKGDKEESSSTEKPDSN